MSVRLVHPKNAPNLDPEAISLGFPRNVHVVRLVQSSKQLLPTDLTLLGMVIEVKLVQFWKHHLFKLVKLFDNVMDERLVQPSKQLIPIYVTVFGITIEVRLVHSSKQPSLIPVKAVERVTDIRAEQA
jgi:hypothetical protein